MNECWRFPFAASQGESRRDHARGHRWPEVADKIRPHHLERKAILYGPSVIAHQVLQ